MITEQKLMDSFEFRSRIVNISEKIVCMSSNPKVFPFINVFYTIVANCEIDIKISREKKKLNKLYDYCNLASKLNIIAFDTECNRFVCFFYIEQDWLSV